MARASTRARKRSVKEVVTAETSWAYRVRRDGYRAKVLLLDQSSGSKHRPRWAAGIWTAASGMSMMRQKYIINTIYDKDWH